MLEVECHKAREQIRNEGIKFLCLLKQRHSLQTNDDDPTNKLNTDQMKQLQSLVLNHISISKPIIGMTADLNDADSPLSSIFHDSQMSKLVGQVQLLLKQIGENYSKRLQNHDSSHQLKDTYEDTAMLMKLIL